MRSNFIKTMKQVTAVLEAAGYDPYLQLTGFIRTGNERYITRAGGARDMVLQMDREEIREYIESYFEE